MEDLLQPTEYTAAELRALLLDRIDDAGLDPLMKSMALLFINRQSDQQLMTLAALVARRVMPAIAENGIDGLRMVLSELGAPDALIEQVINYAGSIQH